MFAIPAFVASSAILAGALALLVHGLARRLLRGRGARRAAVLAAVLVVFGGGLAWMRLVGDVAAGYGDPISLVTANSYDNSWYDSQGDTAWPYFRIPSVMATGLLVHRATTLGLPILVGAILLLVAGLPTRDERQRGARDRPPLILAAGLLGALLAPFHFFFFPAFGVVALLYVVIGRPAAGCRCSAQRRPAAGAVHPGRPVRGRPAAERQRLGGAEVLPRLGVGPAGRRAGRGRSSSTSPTWACRSCSPSGALFVRDLKAAGLPGRLGGGAVRDPEPDAGQRRRLRHEQVLPGDVDRGRPAGGVAHPPLAVAGDRGWCCCCRFPRRCWWPAGPPSTASRCWTGTGSRRRTGSPPTRPSGAVFATDGWLNSPTDAAGRLRLITYTPYIANLGFDPDQRAEEVRTIYCTGDMRDTAAMMRQLGATYLLDSGRPCDCATPTEFAEGPELHKVFENAALRIWQLNGS